MNRALIGLGAAAAALALTACSSTARPAAQAVVTTASPATTAAATTPGPTCAPGPDMLERVVIPGLPATTQDLGSVNLGTCQTLIQSLPAEAGTEAGECTTIAWLSDNPNYDVNATPAPPLKKIQASAGPGC
jgi:hypothetical protein